jgi:hypothetical protein
MTVIIKTQNQFTGNPVFVSPKPEESVAAKFYRLYRLSEGLLPIDCI